MLVACVLVDVFVSVCVRSYCWLVVFLPVCAFVCFRVYAVGCLFACLLMHLYMCVFACMHVRVLHSPFCVRTLVHFGCVSLCVRICLFCCACL